MKQQMQFKYIYQLRIEVCWRPKHNVTCSRHSIEKAADIFLAHLHYLFDLGERQQCVGVPQWSFHLNIFSTDHLYYNICASVLYSKLIKQDLADTLFTSTSISTQSILCFLNKFKVLKIGLGGGSVTLESSWLGWVRLSLI